MEAKASFATRMMRRIELERSRFSASGNYYGTVEAIRNLLRRSARSLAFRTARRARDVWSARLAITVPPVAGLFMRQDVLFIGYLEAGLGLGESLRGLVRAIATTRIPFSLCPFNLAVETRYIGSFMPRHYELRRRHRVNVIELAADQVPAMFRHIGPWRTAHSYNILRTYWELPEAPLEWTPMLQGIREIWVPNSFVEDAFRRIFDGRITIVPPCVDIETDRSYDREHFGLQPNLFYFTFSFDYFSYPARKNPLGVIRAFQTAFPDTAESVGLVIKSTSASDQHQEIKSLILQAARDDRRIKVIDDVFSREEILSLIRESDCFVSLHRSEGFGLGMAEAMAFGKPVIGTDFSGSTAFLSDRTGFPVEFVLRPVQPDEYVFANGQRWAEPVHAAAVAAMRQVFSDQAERQRRAAAGKAFVAAHYGRQAVARIAGGRLKELLAGRPS